MRRVERDDLSGSRLSVQHNVLRNGGCARLFGGVVDVDRYIVRRAARRKNAVVSDLLVCRLDEPWAGTLGVLRDVELAIDAGFHALNLFRSGFSQLIQSDGCAGLRLSGRLIDDGAVNGSECGRAGNEHEKQQAEQAFLRAGLPLDQPKRLS